MQHVVEACCMFFCENTTSRFVHVIERQWTSGITVIYADYAV